MINKPSLVVHTYNTWEAKVRESWIQSYPGLHSKNLS